MRRHRATEPGARTKDDLRAPFAGYDNAMLTSLTHGAIVERRDELPEALKGAMSRGSRATARLSDDLSAAVAYGKRLSWVLQRLPETIGDKRWPEAVLNHVMDEASK